MALRFPRAKKSTSRRSNDAQRSFNSQEFPGAPIEQLRDDYLVAHIDGGARGNPGPAGYGVVIEDHAGRRIDQLSQFLGVQTNNYAEYSGLIAALEYARRNHFRSLKVLSDSELLVKQIKGEYKVRSAPLQELYAKARALIRELDAFAVQHIPREQNREADHLANLAMDNAMMRSRAQSPAVPAKAAGNAVRYVEGVVRGGVVELPEGATLPEGARVTITLRR
ncbi:MAG TPA: ribonuclease HI family protein [Terriglobales bacterium]|nr:ribonuclease HI family protein [Terriglobales bacterium]